MASSSKENKASKDINNKDKFKLNKQIESINNSLTINYMVIASILLNIVTLNIRKDNSITLLNEIPLNNMDNRENVYSTLSQNILRMASLLSVGNNLYGLNQVLISNNDKSDSTTIYSAEKSLIISILGLLVLLIDQGSYDVIF